MSCSQDGRVLIWDTRKPKPAKLIGKYPVIHITVIFIFRCIILKFYAISYLALFTLLDIGVQDIVTCVEWKPTAEHCIVIGTEGGTVHVQDVRKAVGAQLTTYPHTRPVTRMQFANHRYICIAFELFYQNLGFHV